MPDHADPKLLQRLAALTAVISDVDGVLTDARLGLTATGDEIRFFHMKDGMGIRLLQQAGVHVGWLSAGLDTGVIRRRATMLGVEAVDVGEGDKGPRFTALCKRMGVKPEGTLYIGDDVNDLPAMDLAALTACPADAVERVRRRVDFVLERDGGTGCFRELAEMILGARA